MRKTWKGTDRKWIEDHMHLTDVEMAIHFGTTEVAVQCFRKSQRILRPGGRFPKAFVPWNKGKRMSLPWHFAKGNAAPNRRPIGQCYMRGKCVMIKSEKGPKLAHHYLWEITRGPVPKGHCVIFRDGNELNTDPHNLICMHRSAYVSMMGSRTGKERRSHAARIVWRLRRLREEREAFKQPVDRR